MQISIEKPISDYDPNDTDIEKQNPYHGVLTLTIQSKGNENHGVNIPRGPGRPPLVDGSIDDLVDPEDPVIIQITKPHVPFVFTITKQNFFFFFHFH